MNIKKSIIILLFIVFIIVTVLILKNNRHFIDIKSNKSIIVRLKWFHNAQFAGMYVANEDKIYSEAGIKVSFKEPTKNGGSGIESVLNKSANFAIVSPLELLEAIAQNKPVKAVAAIYQESPTVIGSLSEKNIKTPVDLKNKTIGVSGSETYKKLIYEAILSKYQVPVNTITYKNTEKSGIISLTDKDIDITSFYRTEASYTINTEKLAVNYIKPEEYGIHSYNDVIVATDEYITQNPETVKSFIIATQKGWINAIENPEKAVNITLKYTKDKYKNLDYQKQILTTSIPLIKPVVNTKIGEMTDERWEQMYQLYKSSVIIDEFDFRKAYTKEFIN